MNEMQAAPPPPDPPQATIQPRHRFSLIWLIPVVAFAIAAWLGWHTLSQLGPMIDITFQTGNGLVAGQTAVKHKAVDLGRVESVRLTHDMSKVVVRVRMRREATSNLTSHARFWVVRPRFTPGNISGLETLVSGSYIEFDPGAPGGTPQRQFVGLEQPPGVRSDEPGRTFTLKAQRIGSIGEGSPVFYRDIPVGEVLGYQRPALGQPIMVNIFVRKPYDSYVREDSHFWNVSGVSVAFDPQGVHVELESLQALLAGGVAFWTPSDNPGKEAAAGATFPLYPDLDAAESAGFKDNIPFVTYFRESVSGLGRGSPVRLYGLQVGTVTEVRLQIDPKTGEPRIRVGFDIQPERVLQPGELPNRPPLQVVSKLVKEGMRAEVDTANYVTGQEVLALVFAPGAPAADVSQEGEAIVLPSQSGGGLLDIAGSLSQIVNRLNRLPLDQIGANLNATLASLRSSVGGPQLKDALQSLTGTLASVQDLVRTANDNVGPALRRLPEMSAELQQTVARADRVLASINNGYGANSDLNRNLQRLLDQFNDAARSIRLLADFLDRHPEALLRGRPGSALQ